jgi:hypoxanthine-DNA glycosylase
LCGFLAEASYAARVTALQAAGVAVWDVLQSCVRPGSLDTAIERATEAPNDIAGLLAREPGIRRICFNGGMAEAAFRRHVPAAAVSGVALPKLPSTSPANASFSFERKLAAWQALLAPLSPRR